jgi:hypothetical protein
VQKHKTGGISAKTQTGGIKLGQTGRIKLGQDRRQPQIIFSLNFRMEFGNDLIHHSYLIVPNDFN